MTDDIEIRNEEDQDRETKNDPLSNNRLLWVTLPLTVVLVGFFVTAFTTLLLEEIGLTLDPVETTATVTDRRGGDQVKYEFRVPERGSYVRMQLGKPIWSNVDDFRVQSLAVEYVRSDPSVNRPAGESDVVGLVIIGFITIFFGVVPGFALVAFSLPRFAHLRGGATSIINLAGCFAAVIIVGVGVAVALFPPPDAVTLDQIEAMASSTTASSTTASATPAEMGGLVGIIVGSAFGVMVTFRIHWLFGVLTALGVLANLGRLLG